MKNLILKKLLLFVITVSIISFLIDNEVWASGGRIEPNELNRAEIVILGEGSANAGMFHIRSGTDVVSSELYNNQNRLFLIKNGEGISATSDYFIANGKDDKSYKAAKIEKDSILWKMLSLNDGDHGPMEVYYRFSGQVVPQGINSLAASTDKAFAGIRDGYTGLGFPFAQATGDGSFSFNGGLAAFAGKFNKEVSAFSFESKLIVEKYAMAMFNSTNNAPLIKASEISFPAKGDAALEYIIFHGNRGNEGNENYMLESGDGDVNFSSPNIYFGENENYAGIVRTDGEINIEPAGGTVYVSGSYSDNVFSGKSINIIPSGEYEETLVIDNLNLWENKSVFYALEGQDGGVVFNKKDDLTTSYSKAAVFLRKLEIGPNVKFVNNKGFVISNRENLDGSGVFYVDNVSMEDLKATAFIENDGGTEGVSHVIYEELTIKDSTLNSYGIFDSEASNNIIDLTFEKISVENSNFTTGSFVKAGSETLVNLGSFNEGSISFMTNDFSLDGTNIQKLRIGEEEKPGAIVEAWNKNVTFISMYESTEGVELFKMGVEGDFESKSLNLFLDKKVLASGEKKNINVSIVNSLDSKDEITFHWWGMGVYVYDGDKMDGDSIYDKSALIKDGDLGNPKSAVVMYIGGDNDQGPIHFIAHGDLAAHHYFLRNNVKVDINVDKDSNVTDGKFTVLPGFSEDTKGTFTVDRDAVAEFNVHYNINLIQILDSLQYEQTINLFDENLLTSTANEGGGKLKINLFDENNNKIAYVNFIKKEGETEYTEEGGSSIYLTMDSSNLDTTKDGGDGRLIIKHNLLRNLAIEKNEVSSGEEYVLKARINGNDGDPTTPIKNMENAPIILDNKGAAILGKIFVKHHFETGQFAYLTESPKFQDVLKIPFTALAGRSCLKDTFVNKIDGNGGNALIELVGFAEDFNFNKSLFFAGNNLGDGKSFIRVATTGDIKEDNDTLTFSNSAIVILGNKMKNNFFVSSNNTHNKPTYKKLVLGSDLFIDTGGTNFYMGENFEDISIIGERTTIYLSNMQSNKLFGQTNKISIDVNEIHINRLSGDLIFVDASSNGGKGDISIRADSMSVNGGENRTFSVGSAGSLIVELREFNLDSILLDGSSNEKTSMFGVTTADGELNISIDKFTMENVTVDGSSNANSALFYQAKGNANKAEVYIGEAVAAAGKYSGYLINMKSITSNVKFGFGNFSNFNATLDEHSDSLISIGNTGGMTDVVTVLDINKKVEINIVDNFFPKIHGNKPIFKIINIAKIDINIANGSVFDLSNAANSMEIVVSAGALKNGADASVDMAEGRTVGKGLVILSFLGESSDYRPVILSNLNFNKHDKDATSAVESPDIAENNGLSIKLQNINLKPKAGSTITTTDLFFYGDNKITIGLNADCTRADDGSSDIAKFVMINPEGAKSSIVIADTSKPVAIDFQIAGGKINFDNTVDIKLFQNSSGDDADMTFYTYEGEFDALFATLTLIDDDKKVFNPVSPGAGANYTVEYVGRGVFRIKKRTVEAIKAEVKENVVKAIESAKKLGLGDVLEKNREIVTAIVTSRRQGNDIYSHFMNKLSVIDGGSSNPEELKAATNSLVNAAEALELEGAPVEINKTTDRLTDLGIHSITAMMNSRRLIQASGDYLIAAGGDGIPNKIIGSPTYRSYVNYGFNYLNSASSSGMSHSIFLGINRTSGDGKYILGLDTLLDMGNTSSDNASISSTTFFLAVTADMDIQQFSNGDRLFLIGNLTYGIGGNKETPDGEANRLMSRNRQSFSFLNNIVSLDIGTRYQFEKYGVSSSVDIRYDFINRGSYSNDIGEFGSKNYNGIVLLLGASYEMPATLLPENLNINFDTQLGFKLMNLLTKTSDITLTSNGISNTYKVPISDDNSSPWFFNIGTSGDYDFYRSKSFDVLANFGLRFVVAKETFGVSLMLGVGFKF